MLLARQNTPDAQASWRCSWLRRPCDGFVVQAVVLIPRVTLLAELTLRTMRADGSDMVKHKRAGRAHRVLGFVSLAHPPCCGEAVLLYE